MDDFDNDGFLDIVVSGMEPCQSLRYLHNNGDGTFSDRTVQAGLADQLGGLNLIQTDYNNDGWLDIYVMRGGWSLPVRKSLLRNNGDGTFTDVTREAELAMPVTASQTAVTKKQLEDFVQTLHSAPISESDIEQKFLAPGFDVSIQVASP